MDDSGPSQSCRAQGDLPDRCVVDRSWAPGRLPFPQQDPLACLGPPLCGGLARPGRLAAAWTPILHFPARVLVADGQGRATAALDGNPATWFCRALCDSDESGGCRLNRTTLDVGAGPAPCPMFTRSQRAPDTFRNSLIDSPVGVLGAPRPRVTRARLGSRRRKVRLTGRPVTRPLDGRNGGVRRGGRAAARWWPCVAAVPRAAEAGCRVPGGFARGDSARRTPA